MSESAPNVSTELLARERTLLLPLRQRHTLQLVQSGLLERIFTSYYGERSKLQPLNDTDEFVPFRQTVTPDVIGRVAAVDGRETLKAADLEVNGTSYNLYLHRTTQTDDGYKRNAFLAGNQVDSELAKSLDIPIYLPAVGLTEADAMLVASQLEEVAEAVQTHGLTTIDAETLMQDSSTYRIRKPTLP